MAAGSFLMATTDTMRDTWARASDLNWIVLKLALWTFPRIPINEAI